MTKPSKPKNKSHDDKQGHRERLRQRIFDKDAASLHDYEVLEALLFNLFIRGDTKPVGKALLKKFGNFRNLINANPSEFEDIPGIGDQGIVFFALIR